MRQLIHALLHDPQLFQQRLLGLLVRETAGRRHHENDSRKHPYREPAARRTKNSHAEFPPWKRVNAQIGL